MIAIITETFVWNCPKEENELKEYLYKNPNADINVTTEKTITTIQYVHICEKKEEKND